MSAQDGFLSRWSRRKLGPGPSRDDARPAPPEPGPAEAPAAETARAESAEPVAPAAPAALTPPAEPAVADEAALPRIEDLTAETGLAPFLRAGVPDVLRKAALRRMWSLDPAIRDFVGEARDYSFDWNVPGGVPASGPLLPGDDVEAMLRRMFTPSASETGPAPEPASDAGGCGSSGGSDAGDEAPALAGDASDRAPALDGSEAGSEPSLRREGAAEPAGAEAGTGTGPAGAATDPAGTGTVRPPIAAPGSGDGPRRHGGAIPKLD